MDTRVIPQPNVNDEAVQWSRSITGATRDNDRGLSRLALNLEMNNRATAGQMGVIGRQLEEIAAAVEELQARSSHLANPADLRLNYGTGWGPKGPVTSDFSFPPPASGARSAVLTGSGLFRWTGGTSATAQNIYLRMEVRQGASIVGTGRALVGPRPFMPAEFEGNSFQVSSSVRVPEGGGSFQVLLYGYRSADGGTATDSGDLADMSFTLTYGDRV